jgi:hypothetical protein
MESGCTSDISSDCGYDPQRKLRKDNQEYKFYAPGIGLVRDGELLLTKYGFVNK